VTVKFRRCVPLVFLTVASLELGAARADALDDARGILTDPFKIGKGTENIMDAAERTMIHLQEIQNQFGKDADRILGKIDKTLAETRQDLLKGIDNAGIVGQKVTDNAFLRMSDLEHSTFLDATNFVKCSVVTSLQQVQTSLAQSLNQLGERKPRIEIFGWVVLSAEIAPVDIQSPMASFRNIEAIYQAKLDAVKETDPWQSVIDIYSERQRVANDTKCFYSPDSLAFEELYWVIVENKRLENPWKGQIRFGQ